MAVPGAVCHDGCCCVTATWIFQSELKARQDRIPFRDECEVLNLSSGMHTWTRREVFFFFNFMSIFVLCASVLVLARSFPDGDAGSRTDFDQVREGPRWGLFI